ncbi:MAG: M28 family peptidase [Deltaproteobacteria bacterium]|jgi:N-acetylated-alpha-linked acidic dipeptidase|nr:M28 family peptidase [Deltaproteobacteria bacterium]MBW2542431.1 M28 family peptidase [Deltaproteobacteria bacterium]
MRAKIISLASATAVAAAFLFSSLAFPIAGETSDSVPATDQAISVDAPTSFTRDHARDQRGLEQRLRARISRERLRANLDRLASKPHRAGSEAGREIAHFIAAQMRAAGLDAEAVEYVHYISSPISVSAEIVLPDAVPLKLTEDIIEADPFTHDTEEHPGWNAYSASGAVTAQIVYAHHGSRQDFAELARIGVDLKNRIVLMRYFGAGEGEKVLRAQHAGAAAVILYSDPKEDGYVYGDTYPDGPWRPPGSIMRRSVVDSIGDPLSPGWASRPGAKRLSPSDVEELPRIPVLPVSYRDAEKILKRLAGPVAPSAWQGGLPLTYHLGPGPATVRLDVKMDNRDGRIWNAIARIPGSDFPDEWIVLGNHHDAWIYGAGDPSSGTAAFLELGRTLGSLLAEGWRPRRTLLLAIFDAEEITLGGAAEWMEDHAAELEQKTVAILNMDSAVFNPDRPLSVSASPSIHGLWLDAARAVPDPRRNIPTYDVWLESQNRFRNVASVDTGEPDENVPPLTEPFVYGDPIGDDQTVFYLHLALPVSDMYYGADYGMYHSIYENPHWMKTVVDPDFGYHEMMTAYLGTAALRMSQADLLPFDVETAARAWREAMTWLRESSDESEAQGQAIESLDRIAEAWREAAADLNAVRRELLLDRAGSGISIERWRDWNAKLRQVERSFYAPEGLPGSRWSRNLFSALRFESEESTLPGLRWSIEDGKPEQFDAQVTVYAKALTNARDRTRALAAELRAAKAPTPAP